MPVISPDFSYSGRHRPDFTTDCETCMQLSFINHEEVMISAFLISLDWQWRITT